jgi:hypothetical protein
LTNFPGELSKAQGFYDLEHHTSMDPDAHKALYSSTDKEASIIYYNLVHSNKNEQDDKTKDKDFNSYVLKLKIKDPKAVLNFSLAEFVHPLNQNSKFTEDINLKFSLDIDYKNLLKDDFDLTPIQKYANSLIKEFDTEQRNLLVKEKDFKLVYLLARNDARQHHQKTKEEAKKAFLIITLDDKESYDKLKFLMDESYMNMILNSKVLPHNIALHDEFYFSNTMMKNTLNENFTDETEKEELFPDLFFNKNKYPTKEETKKFDEEKIKLSYKVVIQPREEGSIDKEIAIHRLSDEKQRINFSLNEITSFSGLLYQSVFENHDNCIVYGILSNSPIFILNTNRRVQVSPITFMNLCAAIIPKEDKDYKIKALKQAFYIKMFKISVFMRTLETNINLMDIKVDTYKDVKIVKNLISNSLDKTLIMDTFYPYSIIPYEENIFKEGDRALAKLSFELEKILKTIYFIKRFPFEDFLENNVKDIINNPSMFIKAIALKNTSARILNNLIKRYYATKDSADKKASKYVLDLSAYSEIISGSIQKVAKDRYSKVRSKMGPSSVNNMIDFIKEQFNSSDTNSANASGHYYSEYHRRSLICLFENNFTIDVDFLFGTNTYLKRTEDADDKSKSNTSNDDSEKKGIHRIRDYLEETCVQAKKDFIMYELKNISDSLDDLKENQFDAELTAFFDDAIDEESLGSDLQEYNLSEVKTNYSSKNTMRPSSYDFVLPYNFDNSAQQLKDEHNMEYSAYFLNKDDHEIVRLIRGKLDLIKHVSILIY